MEPRLLPYASHEAFCGVCMKTASEGMLVPNLNSDFFTAVQIYQLPEWLCLWCRRRLQVFTIMRSKAVRSQQLLSIIRGFADPFFDRKCLEQEISQLKRETLITQVVAVADFVSREPEYDKVKVEETEGKTRGRRKKKLSPEETDRVEIKFDPELEGDDSWDMVPLKMLKDEDQKTFQEPEILTQNEERNDEIADTSNTFAVNENNSKKITKKLRVKKTTGDKKQKKLKRINKSTEIRVVESKQLDINTAIDDLDNESYIVSEEVNEVHEHIETISVSTAEDRQRAFRMKKLSYVSASHRCEACVLGYQNQEEYDAHMRNHSPSAGSHRCHPCGMYFEKYRQLEKHVQSHYRRHRCRLCRYGSVDYRSAVKHYISQHSRVQFTCWHCNKEFRRTINLMKHMQKWHKKETTIGCAVCGDEYTDEDQLQQHMQSHKPDEIAWHECPICKKKSRHKYNMAQHIKAHERESLPIVCDICQKTFKTQLLLTNHVQRLHTDNSKKLQCDECGKFFYDKGELRIHVQWTHKREGGVECSQCARKFRTAYVLNDHVSRVHNNIPKPKDKLCDLCGRGFSSRKSLKCHRYIHTGERPHACPDCGQRFRQRSAMRLHYKSKHMHMRWRQIVKHKQQPTSPA